MNNAELLQLCREALEVICEATFDHNTDGEKEEYRVAQQTWHKVAALSEPVASAVPSAQISDEREAFEKKFKGDHIKRNGEEYENPFVQSAWEGWQVRAAMQPPAQPTVSDEEQPGAAQVRTVSLPINLHPDTKDLVVAFDTALAEKLNAAELKYGYSNGWRFADWMDECREKLMEHIAKGDPRDVANYCAFLWWHNESTASATESPLYVNGDELLSAHMSTAGTLAYSNERNGWHKTALYAAPVPPAQTEDARNAARYRWLRNPDPSEHREIDVCDDCMNIIEGKVLDAAIDAAMSGKGSGE